MKRRHFLYGGAWLLGAADRPASSILVNEPEARRMRDAVKGGSAAIEKRAEAALRGGPWSVTFQRPAGNKIDAGANDYFSEGPYWWPDPKNPGGPYIRRDGERNPERFDKNRVDLGSMCDATLALGMGAWLLGRKACAERASKVLSVWFLDSKTRMNPHLEFGQAIRGVNTGRGAGMIDTVSLIHATQGIALLELAGGLEASVSAGLRKWFGDYTKWMTTSAKGLAEKKSGNNHATWWTAQVASYASLTGEAATREMAWEHYRRYLVPTEIQPDGSCPREEARTNSLSYSSMNLDAFSVLCRLAQRDGTDLWHFHTDKGLGLEKCFAYLMPFVVQPATWKKQQISPYSAGGYIFPGLAGLGLRSEELLAGYSRLPRSDSAWTEWIDLIVRAS